DAKVLAGGQSLVPLLNMRLARFDALIDILRIPELSRMVATDEGMAMGATVPQYAVEESAEIASRQPLLAEAIRYVGHPQTRNRGTIGGSVAHADPAAELPSTVMALRGTIELSSTKGSRLVDAEDFFVTYFTTLMEPTEMLSRLLLPPWPDSTGHAFLEVSRRHGDFALVGIAAVLGLDGKGTVERADLVFLGCGETPVRARVAEEFLLGERPDERLFGAASEAVQGELEPGSDIHAPAEYRREVAGVLTERALGLALRRAREGNHAGA
ncbi:MAG: FAD binding domain-containing protein, partial [Chloroflexota bacterium]|nr:FAD binding domain-containing protein [Chloroflexota bacterium]